MRRPGLIASLAALVATGVLALSACGQAAAKISSPIRLTDDTGVHLVLSAPAERIVSLGPSNTEILLALGLRRDIVGIDDESVTYAPAPYRQEAQGLAVVGDSYTGLNVEKIAELRPQLVLAMQGVKNVPELRALHIKVVTLDPTNLQGVYRDIAFVGAATGTEPRARALTAGMQQQLSAIAHATARLSRPSVYVELDPTQFYTAGRGSFLDALVSLVGGTNIADRVTNNPYPALSAETVIAQNPQAIVLLDTPAASASSVAARPGWSGIAAVVDHRVYANIDPNLLTEPAPAIVQGVRALAEDLHPGVRIP